MSAKRPTCVTGLTFFRDVSDNELVVRLKEDYEFFNPDKTS